MSRLWRTPFLGRAVYTDWKLDARRKLDWIRDWLPTDAPILEIGSGPESVLEVFREAGFHVLGLDIRDSSFRSKLKPELDDGDRMPFETNSFHTGLLLTMLHHTPDPDAILRETARISKRLIMIEDVYDSPLQKRYTKLADKITNLEFVGHPHTNRDDAGWRETFERLGLDLKCACLHRLAGIFRQAVYVLEPTV